MKKKIIFSILVILFITLIIALYGRFIAPYQLKIDEYKITNNKISDNFHGLKIIHFSDLYYNNKVKLEKIISNINQYKPDLVIFTGDLLTSNYEYDLVSREYLISSLQQINETVGKYAVLGESDSELSSQILTTSNFTILSNSSDNIYKDNNNFIRLVGINDNNFNFEKSDIFTIAITHAGNNFSNYDTADLYLSGHNHNKQVNVWFLNNYINTDNKNIYNNSYYRINNADVFVNNGLGTKNINFRLFSKPTINLYRLTNK